MHKFKFSKRPTREELMPAVPHYSNRPAVQKFFLKHGEHVIVKDEIWFEDGAVVVNSPNAHPLLWTPPEDQHERDKLVCRYLEVVAERAGDAFTEFQNYLHGEGTCPPHVQTDREKIDYLVALQAAAKEARRKLRAAKKQVEASTPAWLDAKRRDEARDAKRRQQFMTRIDSIKL